MPSVSCFFFYVSKNHHAEIGQILRLGTFLAFAGREGDFFLWIWKIFTRLWQC
jgi:hypothetical protein